MATQRYAHSRCAKGGDPAVFRPDQATRVRMAYMRREIATKLHAQANSTTILRLAVKHYMRAFEQAMSTPEGDPLRHMLGHDVARANAGELLPVGEDFVLGSDASLSELVKEQHARALERFKPRAKRGDA